MKKVAIMMSTYNGQNYIDDQIRSILEQKDVEINLYIRDDGSKDKTVEKIQYWREKYPKKIYIYPEQNVGYQKSFLELIKKVPDNYDYYGFSDQDDVWQSVKCIKAIEKLEESNHVLKLYTSDLNETDQNLKLIYKTNMLKKYDLNIYSYWVRARFAGCTYLFSNELNKLAKQYAESNSMLKCTAAHDFVLGSLAYLYGDLVFDENSYIEHRRTEKSATTGGRRLQYKISYFWNFIFKKADIRYGLAKAIIENESVSMNSCDADEKMRFIGMVAHYKDSLPSKWKLLLNPKLKSGNFLFDVLAKIKILISTY